MNERSLLHQTRDHEAIRDDLASYALGTLEATEARQIEAHLATCATCAAALAEYEQVVQSLLLALPVSRPPAGARQRLLERARSSRVAPPAPAVPVRRAGVIRLAPPRLSLPRMTTLRVALVAVALLCLTGAGVAVNGAFGPRQMPYRWSVAMAGTENAPTAAGMVVFQAGGAELIVSGLPPLRAGQVYQFWFARPDSTHVSRALFTVDERGTATVPIDGPPEGGGFDRCGITTEPAGGSSAPTGPMMLYGDW